MSTDLPPEVVEEILSRVPAISLKRLGSTCKRWNALLKDQRFTKKHFHRAAKQFMVFIMHQKRLISVRFNLHEIENNLAAPFIEFKGEVGLTQTIKQVLFHCDGLLLCTTKTDRLMVLNPCTGETKFIRSCNRYEIYSMFALGYEDNKSFRKYKLLRFYGNEDRFVNFEIYEFTSSTWRVLEVTTNFFIQSRGVSLKGDTYWLSTENYLLSFDFSTERFGQLCLPFKDTSYYCEALSTVREEKLSVLHQRFETLKIEVWVATSDKINETILLSWKRFFVVDILKFSGYLRFSSCLSFFIDEEKKLAVCCCDSESRYGTLTKIQDMLLVIGEYGVYREIEFGESVHKLGHAVMFNYAPSLVQIQENTVKPRSSKRKARNLSIT